MRRGKAGLGEARPGKTRQDTARHDLARRDKTRFILIFWKGVNMEVVNKKPTLFQLNIDTQCLFELLSKAQVGDVITYEEMDNLLGKNIRIHRSLLASARRKARKDAGVEFGTIPKVGIKRLNSSEISDTAKCFFSRMNRATKRQANVLRNAKYEELDNAEKVKHNANLSLLGAVSIITNNRNFEKLSSQVEKASSVLPIAKTLELFK